MSTGWIANLETLARYRFPISGGHSISQAPWTQSITRLSAPDLRLKNQPSSLMGRFLVSNLVEIQIYGWLNLENAMELPLDGNLIG